MRPPIRNPGQGSVVFLLYIFLKNHIGILAGCPTEPGAQEERTGFTQAGVQNLFANSCNFSKTKLQQSQVIQIM